jgi:glycine cleavage system H protein
MEEIKIPNDLKYTQTHEWTKIEEDIATVGITEYAAREIGEIVYIELPRINQEVSQNKPFGTIETVKSAFDIFSPVNGIVIEVNSSIIDNPQVVSQSPYDAWMIKVKLSENQNFEELLTADKYKELISSLH